MVSRWAVLFVTGLLMIYLMVAIYNPLVVKEPHLLEIESNHESSIRKLEIISDQRPFQSSANTATHKRMTSAERSILNIPTTITVENTFKIILEAHDTDGLPQTSGGDFWFALLHTSNFNFSTSGTITDNDNGTYSIYFYAGVEGNLNINITLVHPAEAISWLKEVYVPDENCFTWDGKFISRGKKTLISQCQVRHISDDYQFDKEHFCYYGNGPKGIGHSALVCDRPSNRTDCSTLEYLTAHEGENSLDSPVDDLLRGKEYLFTEPNYMSEMVPRQVEVRSRNLGGRSQRGYQKTPIITTEPNINIDNSSSPGHWFDHKDRARSSEEQLITERAATRWLLTGRATESPEDSNVDWLNTNVSGETTLLSEYHQNVTNTPKETLNLWESSEEENEFNLDTEIHHVAQPAAVNVLDIGDANIGIKTFGYWLNNHWHSLQYVMTNWNSLNINKCLAGYDVIMLGDSTMAQWIDALDTRMKWTYKLNGTFLQVRTGNTFNLTFHRNRLTKVLRGQAPFKGPNEHFEPELVNRLPRNNCKYLILIGLAAHYGSWPFGDYKDRLRTLKNSIQKLRRECSDGSVIVVIKKAQARDHPTFQARVHSNNWVFHIMNRIMVDVFSDLNPIFVDIWDMVLSYPSKLEMHMPMKCIQNELDLFLTQVCPLH